MELHPILESGNKPLCSLWYVISSGDSPSQRVGQACIFRQENNSIYVLGGADPSGAHDEVYKLDLLSQRWTKLTLDHFTARYEHCAIQPASALQKIFVFGGANQSDNLDSMQVVDTDLQSCETVQCSGSSPSPRTIHCAASNGDLLYVWGGGHQGSVPVPDIQLHVFDCSSQTWTKPHIKGKLPSARHGHVMAVVDKNLYIHGGMSGSTFHKDMHSVNLADFSCSKVKQRGTVPCARAAHACCTHQKLLLIFGGMSSEKALDDMHHFNTVNLTWSKVRFESPPPTPRLDHSMVLAHLPCADKPDRTDAETISDSDVTSIQGTSSKEKKSGPNIIPVDLWSAGKKDGAAGTAIEGLGSLSLEPHPVPEDSVPVCIVYGGMDESGNIFDDVLLYRLDSLGAT